MKKMWLCSLLTAVVLALSGCTETMVMKDYVPMTRAEMAEQADLIVTGRFLKKGRTKKENDSVYTGYTFQVDQVLKGTAKEKIKIVLEGGRYWFETVEADGMPEMDQDCLLFLRKRSDGNYFISLDDKLYYDAEQNVWGWGESAVSNEGDLMKNILGMTE